MVIYNFYICLDSEKYTLHSHNNNHKKKRKNFYIVHFNEVKFFKKSGLRDSTGLHELITNSYNPIFNSIIKLNLVEMHNTVFQPFFEICIYA
jgi:hypothetical protein